MAIELNLGIDPQSFNVANMNISVYAAMMSAAGCTDPETCLVKITVWKEDASSSTGWIMGDTTMPKELWSSKFTNTNGVAGIYIFYNQSAKPITIFGMDGVLYHLGCVDGVCDYIEGAGLDICDYSGQKAKCQVVKKPSSSSSLIVTGIAVAGFIVIAAKLLSLKETPKW